MNVRQELPSPPVAQSVNAPETHVRNATGRLRSAFGTAVALSALWAGFHWADPASWVIGVPAVLMGSAATLLLPTSPPPRLSLIGMARLASFAAWGILQGAFEVSLRSFDPGALRPGCLTIRTTLPKGRPRRVLALAITLLPGTLTARLEGEMLTVHALDPGTDTLIELGVLEQRVAGLFGLATKELDP